MDHEANGMHTGINLSLVTIAVSDGQKGGKRVESKVTRYVLSDGVTLTFIDKIWPP